MFSVFLAHAPADEPFAQKLRVFLESGCDDVMFAADDAIETGRDLLWAVERGQSADVLVVILSPASNPARWPRETWEPLLTGAAIVLLEECVFPPLLRRGSKFIDATRDRLAAMRRLKRRIRGIQSGTIPGLSFSPDLEDLYRALADSPGTLTVSGSLGERFAQQAAPDFEAVFWIPACGRTLTRIAGELGSQMGMTLDGPVEDNCRQVREVLSARHCLLVLDAPRF